MAGDAERSVVRRKSSPRVRSQATKDSWQFLAGVVCPPRPRHKRCHGVLRLLALRAAYFDAIEKREWAEGSVPCLAATPCAR